MEIKNENGYVIQVKYTRWHIRSSRHSIDIITFMDHIRCVFMLMKSKTKPQWEIKWERERSEKSHVKWHLWNQITKARKKCGVFNHKYHKIQWHNWNERSSVQSSNEQFQIELRAWAIKKNSTADSMSIENARINGRINNNNNRMSRI